MADTIWEANTRWLHDPVASGLFESITTNLRHNDGYLVLSDRMEEIGELEWAFTLRWMGHRGRHPGNRTHKRARKYWCWCNDKHAPEMWEDKQVYANQPGCRLPRLVYLSLHPVGRIILFDTVYSAFIHLHLGLKRLQASLSLDAKQSH